MNGKQRLLSALRREPLDRIPVVPHGYSEPFLRRYFDPSLAEVPGPGRIPFNPQFDVIAAQLAAHERFGFDPLMWMRFRTGPGQSSGAITDWVLPGWNGLGEGGWELHEKVTGTSDTGSTVEYTIETPRGVLRTLIGYEPGTTSWILEPLIKDEADLDLFRFRPDPAHVPCAGTVDAQLQQIGERGLGVVHVPGVWHHACDLRGATQLAYDLHDRPEWVHRFFGVLRDYLVGLVQVLAGSRLEVMILNESHLGMGISPRVYRQFIWPHDREIVSAATRGGLLTIYHNCGLSRWLLELMADTGACCLETLAPPQCAGDVDLADAKRRVGGQVCLRSGLNTRVLVEGDGEAVTAEVSRCLEAAARGGGYICGPVTPLENVPFENLELLADTVKRLSPAYL